MDNHVAYLVHDNSKKTANTPIMFTGRLLLNAGMNAPQTTESTESPEFTFSMMKLMNMKDYSRVMPSEDSTLDNLNFSNQHFPNEEVKKEIDELNHKL